VQAKYAVSHVIGLMKGKCAIPLARTYGARKQNYVGQSFWACGLLVSTEARDEAVIREYIRNKEREDQRLEQLRMWQWLATEQVAQLDRSRVSDPAQGALSGSHNETPDSAGVSHFGP
jgi:hypothetical protein